MTDELDDMTDEGSEKKKTDSDVLVIRNIMQTQDGREYMYKKLHQAGVFESIFDKDPMQHAYNSGYRDFGIVLNREIKEAAPKYYSKMIEENTHG